MSVSPLLGGAPSPPGSPSAGPSHGLPHMSQPASLGSRHAPDIILVGDIRSRDKAAGGQRPPKASSPGPQSVKGCFHSKVRCMRAHTQSNFVDLSIRCIVIYTEVTKYFSLNKFYIDSFGPQPEQCYLNMLDVFLMRTLKNIKLLLEIHSCICHWNRIAWCGQRRHEAWKHGFTTW